MEVLINSRGTPPVCYGAHLDYCNGTFLPSSLLVPTLLRTFLMAPSYNNFYLPPYEPLDNALSNTKYAISDMADVTGDEANNINVVDNPA